MDDFFGNEKIGDIGFLSNLNRKLQYEYIQDVLFNKLKREERDLLCRDCFVRFLRLLFEQKKATDIFRELILFSGPLSVEELLVEEQWPYYSDISKVFVDELCRVLSSRYIRSKDFRGFFFERFLPLYPKVNKTADRVVRNKMLRQPPSGEWKQDKVAMELFKEVEKLPEIEWYLLLLYMDNIDEEGEYILSFPKSDYEKLVADNKEEFYYANSSENMKTVLRDIGVSEKLINDEKYWDDITVKYLAKRIGEIEDEEECSFSEAVMRYFDSAFGFAIDDSISQLLYINGIPDKAFFRPILDDFFNDDCVNLVIETYFKDQLIDRICRFHSNPEYADTEVTKYTIRNYILPEKNDTRSDLLGICHLILIEILLRMLRLVNKNYCKVNSELLFMEGQGSSKHVNHKYEALQERIATLKEQNDILNEENLKLQSVVREEISKESNEKSLLETYFEDNKKLKQQLDNSDEKIELLEKQLQQLTEYVQLMEQEENEAISSTSVQEINHWFVGKKIMFFICETGEYLVELKKQFPDCVIVNNETQSLDGVKADITVAMTKHMSHKLFFKQKSYCDATGTPLVYYNRRNIDGIKSEVHAKMMQ